MENLKFARNWNFEIFAKKIRQIEVSKQTFTSFFAISEFRYFYAKFLGHSVCKKIAELK